MHMFPDSSCEERLLLAASYIASVAHQYPEPLLHKKNPEAKGELKAIVRRLVDIASPGSKIPAPGGSSAFLGD